MEEWRATQRKATAHGIPVWMASLDLSKAFDRVHWPTLWNALRAQSISDQMIWMLSKLYEGQSGEVRGKWVSSRNFPITSGVRQGCVLSLPLFSAVLQWAMKGWRRDVPLKGFDLGDGQPALLDLRFADDILVFEKSYAEAVSLLHDLATVLSHVGLTPNASKTVVLTNEAQPPQHLQLPSGERIDILEHDPGQKWLGCILTGQGSNGQWSMPARHKASPFWAQAVKRKTILYTLFWTDSLHIWQKLPNSSKSATQCWWNFASSSHDPQPLYRQKAFI